MRRNSLLLAACGLYAIAWLVPSVAIELAPGATAVGRGWHATAAALVPVLNRVGPYRDFEAVGPWYQEVLMLLSAASNLLFLTAAALGLRRPGRAARGLEASVWGAALVNTHWFLFAGGGPGELQRADLRIGYYLWVGSFVLIAVALGMLRRSDAKEPNPRHPARLMPDTANPIVGTSDRRGSFPA